MAKRNTGTNSKTKAELMKELNELLQTNYNYSKIKLLELQRLVDNIRKIYK
jgi:hypothetical protein